jgi:co-chaperonin GroES (HSP10)
MPAMRMEHLEDPANIIQRNIGSLEDIVVYGNYILLGVYERPEKTKSGLYLSDITRGEDKHQGKAGLVLKKGPLAFISDDHYDFKGQNVEVGDWVSIWVSDGRPVVIQNLKTGTKQLCRLIEDQHIRMKIPAPDVVF